MDAHSMSDRSTPYFNSEARVAYRFPLTETQLRCWFLDQLRPGDAALNVAVRWELHGGISRGAIEGAFNRIVQRHEILRTRLVERDGEPVQEVLDAARVDFDVIDLRAASPLERDRELDRVALQTAEQPFDLGEAPLLRVTMVRLEDDRSMLLIVAHQSAFDGVSIGVMGREFGVVADAIERGLDIELSDLPLQYGDYALWQNDYAHSGAFEADVDFWKSELANARYFELPPDHRRPSVRSTRGASVYASVPSEFGDRLDAAARKHDLSVFSFGVGVMSMALHRLTGAKEVLIGTQVAGRDDVDLEPLIGVFINNLVLRIPTDTSTTCARQLDVAGRKVKSALTHQNMPFNKLVALLRPTRDLSRNPLISINFNLQRRTFFENRRYETFELVSRPSHAPGTLYDFNLLLIGRPDGWRFTVEYSTDLFDEATARRLLDEVIVCFERAFEAPETLIGDRARVSPAGFDQWVVGTGGTQGASADHEVAAAAASLPSTAKPSRPATPSGSASLQETGATLRCLGLIWSQLLEVPQSDVEGDFFALGGHSLLAIRMLARVEAEFGVKPGIGTFLAAPDLRTFASTIDRLAQNRPPFEGASRLLQCAAWELIDLRAGDPEAPVVVTINHPLFYYILAKRFSPTTAVANLRVPTFESLEMQRCMSLDDICAAAAHEILARYGERPLVLLGLCVNGRLALEISRQLGASRPSVLVAMIDSWAPGAFARLPAREARAHKWRERRRRWQHLLGLRLNGRIGTLDLLRRNAACEQLLCRVGLVQEATEEERLLRALTRHFVEVTRDRATPPCSSEVMLFATQASDAAAAAGMFGWGDILRADTPCYAISGWHEDAISNAGAGRIARILESRMSHRVPEDVQGDQARGPRAGHAGGSSTTAA